MGLSWLNTGKYQIMQKVKIKSWGILGREIITYLSKGNVEMFKAMVNIPIKKLNTGLELWTS